MPPSEASLQFVKCFKYVLKGEYYMFRRTYDTHRTEIEKHDYSCITLARQRNDYFIYVELEEELHCYTAHLSNAIILDKHYKIRNDLL